MSEPFAAALRDALLVPNASESSDAVHQVVTRQLRELDPQAAINATGYFNHSWVPDMRLSWKDGEHRDLFLRFNVRDAATFYDDLEYASGEDDDPVFLDIAQPELAIEAASTAEPVVQPDAMNEITAMVTDHSAWAELGSGVSGDVDMRTATRQVVRGGRGLVDQFVAEQVLESYVRASEILRPERVADTAPAHLREILDKLEAPLSRIASLDLESELRTRWVRGGRAPEVFPSLEGWVLNDRTPEELADLVIALVRSKEAVSDDRWREIARAVSADALGAAARGRGHISGGKLNDLLRVACPYWTARWAWVPDVEEPPRSLLDWSLGGTGLEMNMFRSRAVFSDPGNRFNMFEKPESLPPLAPRLSVLNDPDVLGISIVTSEETVGVQLRATATETLGERLEALMAEQTDVRRSGRIARLEVRVPGTDDTAVLNFETGKANSDRPIPLATFADLVARFMVNLPADLQQQLRERLRG